MKRVVSLPWFWRMRSVINTTSLSAVQFFVSGKMSDITKTFLFSFEYLQGRVILAHFRSNVRNACEPRTGHFDQA